MKGAATSLHRLVDAFASGPEAIARIEIPMVQRDYAQGRTDPTAARIRADFLVALHAALTGGPPLSLDFVFGSIADGTFTPLDGQQRLTTLFLLHRYLAARAGQPATGGWTRFSYATRASARAFCEALVAQPLDTAETTVSAPIKDQPWFLSTWRHDPSVDAMLVMLDAIHTRFQAVDATVAWQRLVDVDQPAVQFHLLPITGIGDPIDLYLKMNSRGKPLTPFERFKARFEHLLEGVDHDLTQRFAHSVDGPWSDMLWPMRGDDNIIDDEFMRYLGFLAERCAWAESRVPEKEVVRRAESAFGPINTKASDNLRALLAAFDTWCCADIPAFFAQHFALDQHEPGKLTLFSGIGQKTVDLLHACCRDYDSFQGPARVFSLGRTLLLDAVIVHRTEGTADFPRRLRVLRNVLEATDNLKAEAMPTLLAATRPFVRDGNLDHLTRVHARQVEDERRKAAFLKDNPAHTDALFALEDHPLLRGCLAVFDFDADRFAARSELFVELFSERSLRKQLTGALLACGNYAHHLGASTYQLGSPSLERDDPWRALFGWDSSRSHSRIRPALMALLDNVAGRQGTLPERLSAVSSDWCATRETAGLFDWRYYLVRYPAMREGTSGLYVGRDGRLGNALCMLSKQRLSSYYPDPYLHAMWREIKRTGQGAAHIEDTLFRGYEHEERWMKLPRSGAAIRSRGPTLTLTPPTQPAHAAAFAKVCATHGATVRLGDTHYTLPIPQTQHDGQSVDAVDRVARGAALLRDLVAAGC